jgi:peroxiredoxin Q/BCP
MTIEVGKKLPAFALQADDGSTVSTKDFAGKRWVLFVYPKAMTSGCTVEACDFRDEFDAFKKKKVPVLGLSKDTATAQKRFREKEKLPYTLLADPDRKVLDALGLIKEKNMYGKKVKGTVRSTFLIGPDGKIEKMWSPVQIKGHVDEVLASLA